MKIQKESLGRCGLGAELQSNDKTGISIFGQNLHLKKIQYSLPEQNSSPVPGQ